MKRKNFKKVNITFEVGMSKHYPVSIEEMQDFFFDMNGEPKAINFDSVVFPAATYKYILAPSAKGTFLGHKKIHFGRIIDCINYKDERSMGFTIQMSEQQANIITALECAEDFHVYPTFWRRGNKLILVSLDLLPESCMKEKQTEAAEEEETTEE